MAESTELCARCHVEPRNSSNPFYCKSCMATFARESRERRKNNLCDTCNFAPKAQRSSYCETCGELCSRCHTTPRTVGCYCQDCQRLNEAESKDRRKDDPCANCHVNPRAPGKSWCNPCRNAKNRADKQRQFPDVKIRDYSIPACKKPCTRCNVNPRNSCHPSYCIDCYRAVKLESSLRGDPCARCGINPRDGIDAYCTSCRRNWVLGYNYGITLEEYNRMFKVQNGQCAICASFDSGREGCSLVVDHNHINGRVRQLLCWSCNKGLGLLGENTDLLIFAIDYLNVSDVQQVLRVTDKSTVLLPRPDNEAEQRYLSDRWSGLKYRYGITPIDYEVLLRHQNRKCAICGAPGSDHKYHPLHVDHIAGTKVVRGLLCRLCNVGIGMYKHNNVFLQSAADYLIKHRALDPIAN